MPISVHWGLYLYIHILHLPYLPIHQPTIPQPLPEMRTEVVEFIEDAVFEDVVDEEIEEGAEVTRQIQTRK